MGSSTNSDVFAAGTYPFTITSCIDRNTPSTCEAQTVSVTVSGATQAGQPYSGFFTFDDGSPATNSDACLREAEKQFSDQYFVRNCEQQKARGLTYSNRWNAAPTDFEESYERLREDSPRRAKRFLNRDKEQADEICELRANAS